VTELLSVDTEGMQSEVFLSIMLGIFANHTYRGLEEGIELS
jgi:hypothetical protein